LSQENQSCLRFSLEESLWFRKGQEVAELVSISLDPDITIQENDQYVTIRGSLELTGEYRNDVESQVEEEEEENVPKQKYVERVEAQEEGTCEFSHRFPVDITIPNNRIQSIYDIDVIVESFDYSIPERSCLKLSAELTISGLYDSTQQEEEVVEEEEEFEVLHRYQVEVPKVEEPEEENQFEDTFLFEAEARKQPEEEKVEAFPKFPTFTYEEPEEIEEPEVEPQRPVVYEHARSEASEPVEEIEEVVEEAPAPAPAPQAVEVEEAEEVKEPVFEESSSSPEAPPKQAKKKGSKKKSMTLTEFFARKEETSDQARLKVCIVQKDDTLDSLADRYDVSVPNLLRYNNLELNQDVYEGQVLYVPVAFAKK